MGRECATCGVNKYDNAYKNIFMEDCKLCDYTKTKSMVDSGEIGEPRVACSSCKERKLRFKDFFITASGFANTKCKVCQNKQMYKKKGIVPKPRCKGYFVFDGRRFCKECDKVMNKDNFRGSHTSCNTCRVVLKGKQGVSSNKPKPQDQNEHGDILCKACACYQPLSEYSKMKSQTYNYGYARQCKSCSRKTASYRLGREVNRRDRSTPEQRFSFIEKFNSMKEEIFNES